jgi:hypothetical protein
MKTYQDIVEKKLNKAGSPGQSVKDFEKDAHSQGIDLGAAKRDAHHIAYPDATYRKGGKPVKGALIGGDLDGGKFHSQKHTHGNKRLVELIKLHQTNKSRKLVHKLRQKQTLQQRKDNKIKQGNYKLIGMVLQLQQNKLKIKQ